MYCPQCGQPLQFKSVSAPTDWPSPAKTLYVCECANHGFFYFGRKIPLTQGLPPQGSKAGQAEARVDVACRPLSDGRER